VAWLIKGLVHVNSERNSQDLFKFEAKIRTSMNTILSSAAVAVVATIVVVDDVTVVVADDDDAALELLSSLCLALLQFC